MNGLSQGDMEVPQYPSNDTTIWKGPISHSRCGQYVENDGLTQVKWPPPDEGIKQSNV